MSRMAELSDADADIWFNGFYSRMTAALTAFVDVEPTLDAQHFVFGRRSFFGYLVRAYRLTPEGQCPRCRVTVPGIWPADPATVRTGDLSLYPKVLPRVVR